MKTFVLLALCLVVVAAIPSDKDLQDQFVEWTRSHNKVYAHDEFQYRWQTWKHNALFIANHNAKANSTFSVAMNKFGDLSSPEFNKQFKGLTGARPINTNNAVIHTPMLPASVDWRKAGAVTGIKNQGQCGSCWSFSTTGSTEGAHVLQAKLALVGLSEQDLVDCSGSYGNQGCNGGLMDDAFQYIIANNGIDTEASYPYTAEDGSCHFSKSNVGATLVAYHDVPSGSEAALQQEIVAVGPISVAIDASHSSFQFYSGGVYNEADCSSTALDHGVLAVGYGTSGTTPYYIVKNSWGTDWGLNGYIWMSRNANNQCGIATMASWPCATSGCVSTVSPPSA
jgi:cathepsin L